MTFEEWVNLNYPENWVNTVLPEFPKWPHFTDYLRHAWKASKAEERERCLSLCRQVASLPHAKSPVAWTTAAGYLAEQIRKGE